MDIEAVADLRTLWFLNTRLAIRVSAWDGTDGIAVLEHRASFGDSPPLHIHHDEDEIFHVLEGVVRYRVGETERRAGPGEVLLAPRGIPHTYRVESREGARMMTVTRGRFEEFVRSMGRPAEHEGLPAPAAPPAPEQADALARACLRFGIEIVGPPLD